MAAGFDQVGYGQQKAYSARKESFSPQNFGVPDQEGNHRKHGGNQTRHERFNRSLPHRLVTCSNSGSRGNPRSFYKS